MNIVCRGVVFGRQCHASIKPFERRREFASTVVFEASLELRQGFLFLRFHIGRICIHELVNGRGTFPAGDHDTIELTHLKCVRILEPILCMLCEDDQCTEQFGQVFRTRSQIGGVPDDT